MGNEEMGWRGMKEERMGTKNGGGEERKYEGGE